MSSKEATEFSPASPRKRLAPHVIPQPATLVSSLVMAAYCVVFVEAVWLCCHWTTDPAGWEGGRQPGLRPAAIRLCCIYMFEVAMALGAGRCAMAGWTRFDILVHHVPYATAVLFCIFLPGDHVPRWAPAMLASLLTAANEALLVFIAMRDSALVGKLRRLYGFSIVLLLVLCEFRCYVMAMHEHVSLGSAAHGCPAICCDQLALGAVAYHTDLLSQYIRRWRKHKAL